MARLNGDIWLLKLADDGETELQLGYGTSASMSMDVNIIDTTNKNSSRNSEHILGNRTFTIDFEAFHDSGASDGNLYSSKEVIEAITNGTNIDFIFGPDGTSGEYYISGSGDISNLSIDAPHNGAVTFSGTLQVNGAITVTNV